MKRYLTYLPGEGNKLITRIGSCLDEDFNTNLGDGSIWLDITNTIETISIDTFYIDENNNLIAYTEQELATKNNKPSWFHEWDIQTLSWVDNRNLEQLKISKWVEIKSIRDTLEFGTFIWDNSEFDGDSESQRRIQGAAQLAMIAASASQPFEIDWTLADNSVRTLSGEEMISVGLALGTHVGTIYATARILRDAIEAATTEEEVGAIAWP